MNPPSPPLAVSTIEDADIPDIVALWQRCGSSRPWNDPYRDIARARMESNSTVLVGRDASGAVVASVMVGHDGHRGWVYYVTVDPAARFMGFGRAIMAAAEDWLRARGLEKIQLMVRADNAQVHAFYAALGYFPQERVTFAKWLDGRPPTP